MHSIHISEGRLSVCLSVFKLKIFIAKNEEFDNSHHFMSQKLKTL